MISNNGEVVRQKFRRFISYSDMETDAKILQLRKPKYCKYPFCGATNKRLPGKPWGSMNRRFYRFPKDPTRLAVWKGVCNIHPNVKCTNFYICEDHFSPLDFNNPKFPKRLSNQAIPIRKPGTGILPEEIRIEHDYAVLHKESPNHESDKITSEKHDTKLHIDLKYASLEQKMNLLNSVCVNQKNFISSETKPNSKQSIVTNSVALREKGTSNYIQAEVEDSVFISSNNKAPHGTTSILRRILDDSIITNAPETTEEPLPFKIDSVYSSINNNKKKSYSKNIMTCKFPSCQNSFSHFTKVKSKKFFIFPRNGSRLKSWKVICGIDPSVNCSDFFICEDHFSLSDYYYNDTTRLNMYAIPKPFSRSKLQDEHNYAHQKPCQLMDHDYC